MKPVSIRELHASTGAYVRKAAKTGEILISDRGRVVAKIVHLAAQPETPYFARRNLTPAFRKLLRDGKLRGGTDSTHLVSDDRQDRV